GHVEENAVALRAQQQRDVLVGTVAAHAKRIDGPGRECLATPVEGAKMLAQPKERLIGLEANRQPAQPASVPGREVVIAAATGHARGLRWLTVGLKPDEALFGLGEH